MLNRDLTNPRWMYLKGGLFILIGCLSAGLILAENPDWKVACLLGLTVWAFCRAYYFAFYVIERYIDPKYRFAGLFSLIRYVVRQMLQRPIYSHQEIVASELESQQESKGEKETEGN